MRRFLVKVLVRLAALGPAAIIAWTAAEPPETPKLSFLKGTPCHSVGWRPATRLHGQERMFQRFLVNGRLERVIEAAAKELRGETWSGPRPLSLSGARGYRCVVGGVLLEFREHAGPQGPVASDGKRFEKSWTEVAISEPQGTDLLARLQNAQP